METCLGIPGQAGMLLKAADPTGMLTECFHQIDEMYSQAVKSGNAQMREAALRLLVTLLPYNAGAILGIVYGTERGRCWHHRDTTELLQAIAGQDLNWSKEIIEIALRQLPFTRMWPWTRKALRQQLEYRLAEATAA